MISTVATRNHPRHCKAQSAAALQNFQTVLDSDAKLGMANVDQDRLAHAQIFANELSDSRLREMAKASQKRWTSARRSEKAKIIQSVKPWNHATGPRTEAGKAKSALNAWKGGNDSRDMDAALTGLSRSLRRMDILYHLGKRGLDVGEAVAYACAEADIVCQRIMAVWRADIQAGFRESRRPPPDTGVTDGNNE